MPESDSVPQCDDDISESQEFSRNAAFRVIIIRQLHFANSTHTQTPNQGTLFIVQIKNHRGITLAREARLFPFPFPVPFPLPFPFLFAFSSSFLSLFLSFCPCPFLFLFLFFFLFFSFCDTPFLSKGMSAHSSTPLEPNNSIRKSIANSIANSNIFLNFHFLRLLKKSIYSISNQDQYQFKDFHYY